VRELMPAILKGQEETFTLTESPVEN